MATNPDRSTYFPPIEETYGQPMSYWFDQLSETADQKYPEQVAFLRETHGFTRTHANALVMYSRGSKNAHRASTLEGFLEPFDASRRTTVRAIFAAITSAFSTMEIAIDWNQPMLKLDGHDIFGVSVHTHHLLIAPWSKQVLDDFAPRLAGYKVNKRTIQIPVDWTPDATLLTDMATASVAEFQTSSGSPRGKP